MVFEFFTLAQRKARRRGLMPPKPSVVGMLAVPLGRRPRAGNHIDHGA